MKRLVFLAVSLILIVVSDAWAQDGKVGFLCAFLQGTYQAIGRWPDSNEGYHDCLKPYGLVLALDEHGKIIQSLHEPIGKHLKEITSAREYGGYLYLGSLHNDRIGKYKLP